MREHFGRVGEHQAKLVLPYPMRLAWDLDVTVRRFTCHEKVRDSLGSCLRRILDHYGSIDEVRSAGMDLFGGCLNVRKKRGGSTWSIHSWGAAIDLDPANNKLRWNRERATMPEEIMDIFESEGWTSLGRATDRDYMHFQAATL